MSKGVNDIGETTSIQNEVTTQPSLQNLLNFLQVRNTKQLISLN